MTTPTRCTIDLDVRYFETDQMGVVHHANYVVWFEQARTDLCKQTGYHYADIERLGYLLVVTNVQVRYIAPARYGDTVRASCWIDRLPSLGMQFAYEISRGKEILVRGRTEHIWLKADTGRPSRVPPEIRHRFEKLAAAPAQTRA